MSEPREPGWYQDPFGTSAGDRRYWDGETWLAVRAEPTPEPQAGAMPGASGGGWRQTAEERPWQGGEVGDERSTTPDGAPLASWGRRLVAYLVDGALLAMVTLVTGQVAGVWPALADLIDEAAAGSDAAVQEAFAAFAAEHSASLLAVSVIGIAASGIYHIVLTVRRGRTLGKQLLGIRVRMRDEDANPSWGSAGLRWLVHFGAPNLLSGLPLVGFIATIFPIVDGLWPIWDQRRQAIHDRIAKTNVVVG